MHEHSVYRDMPLDMDKVFRQLSACGNIVPDRYFSMAVLGDTLLGGFYGHVRRTFFCDELLAHDMGWWVTKTRRGSAAAVLLLADFERWAREQGAKKMMVGQSTAIDIDKTTRLYEHCGFRVIGFNTVKDL
jgi:GNAT superfamily N-acetyltransferase